MSIKYGEKILYFSKFSPIRSSVVKSSVLFEVQSLEVGSFEVGSFEVGSFEVGSFEVGSFEVGSFEVGSFENQSFEVQSFEVQSVNRINGFIAKGCDNFPNFFPGVQYVLCWRKSDTDRKVLEISAIIQYYQHGGVVPAF
jgi:hypothetical protein